MSIDLPYSSHRWRCRGCGCGCGNLTRFDATRKRRTTDFWHFDLAGEHEVEVTDVKGEAVESVSNR